MLHEHNHRFKSTMNTILSPEYYSTSDSGLVGYWRMDEGVGQTAEDLSFYSNTATLGTSPNPDANDPAWVSANILIVNVENENNSDIKPTNFSLSQNYPNPFNPTTNIKFSIPSVIASGTKQSQMVTIKVYDILGNEVATLVNEELAPGKYEVRFDAGKFSTGIYFYKLTTGVLSETKKMILLR